MHKDNSTRHTQGSTSQKGSEINVIINQVVMETSNQLITNERLPLPEGMTKTSFERKLCMKAQRNNALYTAEGSPDEVLQAVRTSVMQEAVHSLFCSVLKDAAKQAAKKYDEDSKLFRIVPLKSLCNDSVYHGCKRLANDATLRAKPRGELKGILITSFKYNIFNDAVKKQVREDAHYDQIPLENEKDLILKSISNIHLRAMIDDMLRTGPLMKRAEVEESLNALSERMAGEEIDVPATIGRISELIAEEHLQHRLYNSLGASQGTASDSLEARERRARLVNDIASAPQETQDLFNAMCQARCVRKKAMDILGLDSWSSLYRRMRELDSFLIDKGWRTADGRCADPS